MSRLLYLPLIFAALNANAQNCESVLALSKTTSSTVQDQSSLEQLASSFCSDYSKAKASGSSMDAGGSYGLFSASVGMSNQSAESIASRYCSSSDTTRASSSAFRNYVESISDKAYLVYQSCLALANSDLKFSVDQAAILPTEFSISAGFSSSQGKPSTTLQITPSAGIDCVVDGKSVQSVTLNTGSAVSITCRRPNPSKSGYVRFVNTGSSRVSEQMTIPWSSPTPQVYPAASSGVIELRAEGTRKITDTSQCPTTSDAYRGTQKGRVNFDKAFREPPVVSAGITHIDSGIFLNSTKIDTTGMRLNFTVTSVDRTGFSYQFVTWCDTMIAGATAS